MTLSTPRTLYDKVNALLYRSVAPAFTRAEVVLAVILKSVKVKAAVAL